jgi:hypothetical protein
VNVVDQERECVETAADEGGAAGHESPDKRAAPTGEAAVVRKTRVTVRGTFLYDPRPDEHQHFVCRDCGLVEDLDASVDARSALAAARRRGYVAEDSGLVVSGLCDACAGGEASAAGRRIKLESE